MSEITVSVEALVALELAKRDRKIASLSEKLAKAERDRDEIKRRLDTPNQTPPPTQKEGEADAQ